MGLFDDYGPLLRQILKNQLDMKIVLSAIVTQNAKILTQEAKIMDDLNKILDQAEANAQRETNAETSIEGLITDLAKQVADLKNTAPTIPQATLDRITALSTGMADRAAKMAAKVVENTEHA